MLLLKSKVAIIGQRDEKITKLEANIKSLEVLLITAL